VAVADHAKEKDERNARIRELWLDCYSQEEIAAEVGLTDRQVRELLEGIPEVPVVPASLQSWTVWDEWADCDDFRPQVEREAKAHQGTRTDLRPSANLPEVGVSQAEAAA
jgi:hypothetical protein